MHQEWNRRLFAGVFVAVSAVASFASAAEVNMARGKTYTFSIPPNYPNCTDEGDPRDLTDEIRSGKTPKAQYWTEKGTVGWMHTRSPVIITIDLGRSEPIMGVTLGSAAGGAGVSLPSSIAIMVSHDGEDFRYVGDLVRLSETRWPEEYGTFATYDYRTTALMTKGRFVRFIIVPSSLFVFTDEIEVFRGDASWLETPLNGEAMRNDQVTAPLRLTQIGCYRRTRVDLEQVQAMVQAARIADAQKQKLQADLAALYQELSTSDWPEQLEGFKAIAPLNDLHRRVLAVRGRLLALQKTAALVLWHTHPYQLLNLFEPPVGTLDRLEVRMAGNETRAETINLTNSSTDPADVRVAVEGLGSTANPPFLRVFQVEYVDTREGKWVASALIELESRDGMFATTVPAGMTRQLWFSFATKSVAPGEHSGRIKLTADRWEKTVPLKLSVAPMRLPDRLTCSLGMFDYAADKLYQITEANQALAVQDMRQHLVDIVWCGYGPLPMPKPTDIDAQGNLIGKIDYTRWDIFVRLWPDARHYAAFASFHAKSTFAGRVQGSAAFDTAVAQWAVDWARHNREIGLTAGQAVILFIDEPGTPEQFEATFAFARPFHSATDEIRVFCDPVGSATHTIANARKALEQCDIISPPHSQYTLGGPPLARFYRELTERGRQLWFYDAGGPTRQYDPAYFRFMPWNALASNAKGVQFWAYGATGIPDSFNEYTAVGQCCYSPIYLTTQSITTSKHWEAVREGLEDYQYVVLLRDKVARLGAKGDRQPVVTRAQELAWSLPTNLTDELRKRYSANFALKWNNPSAQADKARYQVLDMLSRLNE